MLDHLEERCECDMDECEQCHPVVRAFWRVKVMGYSGIAFTKDFDDRAEARADVAKRLRSRRRAGHRCHPYSVQRGAYVARHRPYGSLTYSHGQTWECEEPEGCVLVPDTAGFITIDYIVQRS